MPITADFHRLPIDHQISEVAGIQNIEEMADHFDMTDRGIIAILRAYGKVDFLINEFIRLTGDQRQGERRQEDRRK
jgi:hypothetical protein